MAHRAIFVFAAVCILTLFVAFSSIDLETSTKLASSVRPLSVRGLSLRVGGLAGRGRVRAAAVDDRIDAQEVDYDLRLSLHTFWSAEIIAWMLRGMED
eukprot:1393249-Amorphochlora_amoeboformis.AAC.2